MCVFGPRADHSFSTSAASGSQLETYPVVLEDHYLHPSLGSFLCLLHTHTHTHVIYSSGLAASTRSQSAALAEPLCLLSVSNDSRQESTCRMMTSPCQGVEQFPLNGRLICRLSKSKAIMLNICKRHKGFML